MARIAIDASRTTVKRRTGTENYALQLIRSVLALETDHRFDLYFRDAPPDDIFPKAKHIKRHVIPWKRAWTHIRFAAELWRTRPDVTWVPAHTLPRFFPGRSVVTVHDLGYLAFPEAHPDKERKYLDWSTRYSAERATCVMADSHATERDLIEKYSINAGKIRVVYPGIDERLHPVTDEAKLATVRAKYDLPERYFFYIGTLQPRKNIGRLAQAFDMWRKKTGDDDTFLALGGKIGWLYNRDWTSDIDNIHMLGFVDDEDLATLYSGSQGFLMPSLFEGFGFPILEAMQCGTPVLCSETTSLPELAGNAAVLVNPLEVEAIADGIQTLINQRQALIQKGYTQAAQFSWDAAAKAALAVLEEAIQ